MKAKERTIQKLDEMAKKHAAETEKRRKKGGMTQAEAQEFKEYYKEKERLKKELKKARQDETGKKNPPLERW